MHGWFGTNHRGMEGLELGESRWSGKLFVLNKQTNKKTREWPKTNIWPEPNMLSDQTKAQYFWSFEAFYQNTAN